MTMKLTSFVLVVVALAACSSKPKTGYKDLKTVRVDSLNLNMILPASYGELSIVEEMLFWKNSDEPREIIESHIKYLRQLAWGTTRSQFYADTVNIGNNIRIIENRFPVKIGRFTSAEGFLVVDEFIQEQGKLLGIQYEALSNTYFTQANGNNVMKIRYKTVRPHFRTAGFLPSTDQDEVSYATFYLVSGNGSVAIVVHHEIEDFEYFVRTIKFD